MPARRRCARSSSAGLGSICAVTASTKGTTTKVIMSGLSPGEELDTCVTDSPNGRCDSPTRAGVPLPQFTFRLRTWNRPGLPTWALASPSAMSLGSPEYVLDLLLMPLSRSKRGDHRASTHFYDDPVKLAGLHLSPNLVYRPPCRGSDPVATLLASVGSTEWRQLRARCFGVVGPKWRIKPAPKNLCRNYRGKAPVLTRFTD